MRVCGALSFCVLLTAGRAEAFALSTKLAVLPRGTASPSLARPGLAPPASRAGRRSGGSPLRMAEVTFSGAVDIEARKTLEIALDTSVQSGVMYVKLVDESSPDPSSHTTALESYAYSWSEPVAESPAGDMCGAGDLVVDITGRSCDILPELSTLTPSGAESLVLHRAPDNALVLVVEQTNAARTVCSVGAVKLKQTRSPVLILQTSQVHAVRRRHVVDG